MTIFMKLFAAIAITAGLSYTAGGETTSTKARLQALTANMHARHIHSVFIRADRDCDGHLNADEYASLHLVTTELAALNGFIRITIGDMPEIIALPASIPDHIHNTTRTRLDQAARQYFHTHSGDNHLMNKEEFAMYSWHAFQKADSNNDGTLKRKELTAYAVNTVTIRREG